ncbi:MAG: hypothetical protein ACOC4M_05275 [Promethearchaeia archaeon]
MPKIEIRCPICRKKGEVEVPDVKSGKGLMAINVEEGLICEHNFIAYIDKNLNIRDRYVADFQIQIKEEGTSPKAEGKKDVLPDESLDLDIISYNLPKKTISYILRAIFLGKKIAFIFDQKFLTLHFDYFFKYITQGSFDFQLEFLTTGEYNDRKKQYMKYFVLRKNEILRDKEKIMKPKPLKEIELMVEKFFDEEERKNGLIVLKNEVRKYFLMAEYVKEYCQDQNKDKINSKVLIDSIYEHFNIRITFPFLNLLVETIEGYFEYELPEISEVSDFLGFL